MSFKPEVRTDTSGRWYGNALRFATEKEAADQVSDLACRWLAVIDARVVTSDDPVNYAYVDGRLVSIARPETPENI
jgi:hypothetical protein